MTSPAAPGVYTTVVAAAPSPDGNSPTGTWFVAGQTQQGPTGVPIPITSMNDYARYLGGRVSYGNLYDSLDEFFHDGGVLAYVSRVVGPAAAPATVILQDQNVSPQSTVTLTAVGAGTWGNNISITIATGSVNNSYTITVNLNNLPQYTTPNLFTPADAVTYLNSLPSYQGLVTAANDGSSTGAPTNNPANGTFSLSSGSDDTTDVGNTQYTNALATFIDLLGPGQVSVPGITTNTVYVALATHAAANNRVALLDVADSANTSTLATQASTFQSAATSAAVDPSYGSFFAPWLIIPGIYSSNPGASSPVPNRVVPPSALAAAKMAQNDLTQDANRPAAGLNGQSSYVIGVTQTYSEANRGILNADGINVIKNVFGNFELYGYRSLALDPNWVFLNNVRFRMQVVYDFDVIGESFVFSEIDGKGQLFAAFAGSLTGKCASYYTNKSLFGDNANEAFSVNTGPQVNTAATIAAGQICAQVGLKMSPFGEQAIITVTKYLSNQTIPS